MMKWGVEKTEISDDVIRFRYTTGTGAPLSFRAAMQLWADQSSTLFCGFHCQVLSDIPFKAYKWETPVVDEGRFDRQFEFVALNSPGLDRQENQSAFQNQFDRAGDDSAVIQFSNLGRNAILVVPIPLGSEVNHCHLASFIGTCRASEESLLWQRVGKAMLERVSNVPVWLSTAGGGVAWLHVRLDDRPKYYGYNPYKSD